ncbi:hypothetical protein THAOC_15944, partial [Thalassiosira oceanica]
MSSMSSQQSDIFPPKFKSLLIFLLKCTSDIPKHLKVGVVDDRCLEHRKPPRRAAALNGGNNREEAALNCPLLRYEDMSSYRTRIVEAIVNLKARSPGSNSLTIKKCVRANMPADEEWTNSVFLNALKKMVADGDLVQTEDHYMFSQKFWEEKVQKSAGASKDAAAVSSSRLWTLKRKIDINVSSEPTQGVYVPRSCGACEFYPVKRERIFLPRTEYIYHVMVDIEENRQCDYGHCDD